jgi:trimeric autotransporter adhesin
MRAIRYALIAIVLLSASSAQAQNLPARPALEHSPSLLDRLKHANAVRPRPEQASGTPFLYEPAGLAADSSGNIYIAAPYLNEILKATPAGALSIFAGTGAQSYTGDEGPAVDATLNRPFGVAVDSVGNVYIADTGNFVIREVTTNGDINTVAGGGTPCAGATDSVGDGCAPLQATLSAPAAVGLDNSGNLLIADTGDALVRRVSGGLITAIAGGGTGTCGSAVDSFGDGCPGSDAVLISPQGLAADTKGNIFIADFDAVTVRVVNSAGTISLYAGDYSPGFTSNGVVATTTTLDAPQSLAVDATGNLFITDFVTNEVRRVDATTHIITDVAGNVFGPSIDSGDGGPATSATFTSLFGVAISSLNGDIYIADIYNNQVRVVNSAGTINTFVAPTLTPATSVIQANKQIINTSLQLPTVTLTNTSGAPLTISSITFSNSVYTESDTCVDTDGPIPAGGTCQINITFTPTVVCDVSSSNDATVTISHDGPGGASFLFLSGEGSGTPGLTTIDMTTEGVTPATLAQSLVGSGVTISNVTYTGVAQAGGTFSGGQSIIGFDSGVILSNGAVANVVGPNCSTGISADNGVGGDTDLQSLLPPNAPATTDAAVLEFDFVPVGDTLDFKYVFASDEYTEEVGFYDDVFGFFVNGANAALIPGTTTPVSVNTINNGNSQDSAIPISNPQYFIDNDIQYPSTAPINTEMDGLTVVLSVTVPVNQGVTNHIKLAIADTGDHIYDSNVFLASGSINSSPLDFSVGTLAFGNQAINTISPAQIVTITNSGSSAVSISSIAASSGYAETNTCGESIAAQGTCTVSVTFTPTATGFDQGDLNVTSSANGPGTLQSVGLSGTGVNPLTITLPASVTFPATPINTTSSPMTVTVQNNTSSVASFVLTSFTTSTPFAVSGGTCVDGQPGIAKGVSCTIELTFTPTSISPSSGSLVLVDNAAGSPQSVALSGTTGTQSITITVSPQSVTFPPTPVNTTSSPMTVTVMNTSASSTANVEFSSVTATGPFAVSGGTCPVDLLAPGQTCAINVTFTPTGKSASSGTLTLSDNATGSPQTVSLSGTTQTAAPFTLTVGGNGSSTATVSPGDTAVFPIVLTPSAGVTGSVNLTCVPSTPTITCTVTPTSVTLTGTGAVNTGISVVTFCSSTPPAGPRGQRGGPWRLVIPLGSLLGLLLMLVTCARAQRHRWIPAMAALVFLAVGVAGCKSLPKGPNGATPPGSYTLVLTGTLNGQSQSVTLTLNVQ